MHKTIVCNAENHDNSMNIFLKLKNWQVFLIWILGVIQLAFFIKSDFWFISFGIYFGLFSLWIYSIGKVLNKNNPELIKRMNIWWILYSISLIPLAINYRDSIMRTYDRIDTWIIILTICIGFIAIAKITIYSAKTIKRAELGREYETADLVSEIFLIYFFIIGIWILQPRLNKIMAEK
ncbi:hypothetical protein DFQ10_108134 [Winogradskyella eximia]|uniref:Uncharacterized protein n=1 Tax=Winogradskyella eximia TaxID=262006 RepID=A0A3D9GZP4_9FLAO|nr:hypothetical protein [Winogradskyella eximia]RED42727.1 hypothetical protein DFQ10_108134 [Winogradskyella eximia]